MSYSLLDHGIKQGANGGDSVTSDIFDTSLADFIAIGVASAGDTDGGLGAVPTLIDSKTNTWLQRTTANGQQRRFTWWSCRSGAFGSGHTFTATRPDVNKIYPTMFVLLFSGSVASPFDTEPSAGASGTGITSLAAGTITPAEVNELTLSGLCYAGAGAVTASAGTISDQAPLVGGQAFGGCVTYAIQTSIVAWNPLFSWSGSGAAAAQSAAFKAATVAPPFRVGVINQGHRPYPFAPGSAR